MTIHILDEARDDLIAGGLFYREQGGDELKDYFIDSVFASIDTLMWRAGTHPVVYGCYRMLVDHFPYSVYYRIENGSVMVWRVLDNRCDPVWVSEQVSP